MIRRLSTPLSALALDQYPALYAGLYASAREDSLQAARKSDGVTRRNHVRLARAHHRNLLRCLRQWREDKARAASYRSAALGAGSFAERLLGSVS
jgi:hypothetical protein